jgi:hypothetical protein
MRALLIATFMMLAAAGSVFAQKTAVDDYGLSRSCKGMPNAERCEARRIDFKTSLPLSLKGDRAAQNTVALCLRTGCGGAVAMNNVTGCAWLLVIANSPSASVNDRMTLRDSCSPLSEAQKDAARVSAAEIYEKITKRQLLAFQNDL